MRIGIGVGVEYTKLGETFTPASISDLKVWLKGDSGITLVGGEVDVWADQSGNGNNVSAPAAIRRPTTSTKNGKTTLVFAGSTAAKALQNLSSQVFRNISGGTIIAAGKCNDSASGRQQINIGTPTLTGRAVIGYKVNSAVKSGATAAGRRTNADSISAEVGKASLDNSWLINSAIFNYGAATLTALVNNVQTELLSPFQTAGTTPNDGGAITIGANNLLSGGWMDGEIAEILVFEKILNSTELEQVQTYLASRWL
jgi:hypothetical protein